MRWQDDRADAERLAAELHWRIGQSTDGAHLLYRPCLPEPIPCKTWLGAVTYMRDYIERRRIRAHALDAKPHSAPEQRTSMPAQARVTRLGARPAAAEDAGLPEGKILP